MVSDQPHFTNSGVPDLHVHMKTRYITKSRYQAGKKQYCLGNNPPWSHVRLKLPVCQSDLFLNLYLEDHVADIFYHLEELHQCNLASDN
jgi:hypothetical protein